MHVDVTDKEVNSGDYYWGKSAALDSLLNKYFALPLVKNPLCHPKNPVQRLGGLHLSKQFDLHFHQWAPTQSGQQLKKVYLSNIFLAFWLILPIGRCIPE